MILLLPAWWDPRPHSCTVRAQVGQPRIWVRDPKPHFRDQMWGSNGRRNTVASFCLAMRRPRSVPPSSIGGASTYTSGHNETQWHRLWKNAWSCTASRSPCRASQRALVGCCYLPAHTFLYKSPNVSECPRDDAHRHLCCWWCVRGLVVVDLDYLTASSPAARH